MKNNKSALKVNKGVEKPPMINASAIKKINKKKAESKNVDYYVNGILKNDRAILAKAITLIESSLKSHREIANGILEACIPYSGKSIRIGITGVPGVGKSTFIEAFGTQLTNLGHKVAILAIDPSSSRTKGSILGDKTRMENLSNDKNAYIRPSPAAGSLGGVASTTYETIILCECAGYDIIIIETVGVGQSEIEAHSMVDFFLLLMLSGAGDELQGIKRGIIEMSDAIIINKADGENIAAAARAMAEYKNALHLFPPTSSEWIPRTGTCSSIDGNGIIEVWKMVNDYVELTSKNGFFQENRKHQEIKRFHNHIKSYLINNFYSDKNILQKINDYEQLIESHQIDVYTAANSIINQNFSLIDKNEKSNSK